LSDSLQSLNRTLTFLHSPHTPAILRSAIPAATNLIERTTQPGSEQRFTQLCALLGDGVIGSVWMYSSEAEAVEASVEVLPIIVRALGIGATRYLKVPFDTFKGHSDVYQVWSGVGFAAHAPTSPGSFQGSANITAAVFPPCVGHSHTRMRAPHRELEEYYRRRCGKMLGHHL
jgi:Tti2 family